MMYYWQSLSRAAGEIMTAFRGQKSCCLSFSVPTDLIEFFLSSEAVLLLPKLIDSKTLCLSGTVFRGMNVDFSHHFHSH